MPGVKVKARWRLGPPLVLATLVAVALWNVACSCDPGGGGASGESLVGGGWGNFQGMATTNYYGMFHGFRSTAYAEVKSRVGAAGTLTAFSGAITAAPPTGSWSFTVFKNGVAQTMACSISGASTSCVDATSCIDLAAGDEIAVEVVPSGASANAGGPRWTAVFAAGDACP
ncbi:MAG: hypothetical protein ACE5GX_18090 [Thermoanaerobaculia bacterium]